MTSLPFSAIAGAKDPKIVMIGEAWGASEAELRKPFVGVSGKELFLMLGQAFPGVAPDLHAEISSFLNFGYAWTKRRDEWFEEAGVAFTNVLNSQPPGNKIIEYCGTKAEVGKFYRLPALARGKYLLEEWLPELARLEEELLTWRPNLVVALGNTALWALTRTTNIGTVRGTICEGSLGAWRGKVLPTYHPAGVLYQWSWRPLVISDLMKAEREGKFPEVRRPDRWILVSPTIEEVEEWTEKALLDPPKFLATDVETECGQITCVGFSDTRGSAIVIPFWSKAKKGWNYWENPSDEVRALRCVELLLENPSVKVLQNGIYDLQYFLTLGLRPKNFLEDTMLRHHALFPEMQKGLGFLGSIYCEEPAWKLMRRKRPDTEKHDE